MATFKRDLEASAGENIIARGTRFNYVEGSSEIVVEINGTRNTLQAGQGFVFSTPFDQVYIETLHNQTGAIFYIGDQELTDARVVGDVRLLVDADYTCGAVVTIVDGDPLLIPAVARQTGLVLRSRVSNPVNQSIIITDQTGAGVGYELGTGESVTLPFSGDLYVKRSGANDLELTVIRMVR